MSTVKPNSSPTVRIEQRVAGEDDGILRRSQRQQQTMDFEPAWSVEDKFHTGLDQKGIRFLKDQIIENIVGTASDRQGAADCSAS